MGALPGWRKAFQAFHVCVSPRPYDDRGSSCGPDDIDERGPLLPLHSSDGAPSSAAISIPGTSVGVPTASASIPASLLPPRFASSSSNQRTSISAIRSVCAICLEVMKPGHGQVLFTAECLHAFHFHCITSSVRFGNLVCPVCRATWNQVPCPALIVTGHHHHGHGHGHHHSSRSNGSRPPPLPYTASSDSFASGERPSLIIPPESEQRQPRLYSLQPVLRRFDDLIARLQSTLEKQKQMKSDETEGGRYDDDEELLEGSFLDYSNSAEQAPDLTPSTTESSSRTEAFGDHAADTWKRKPAMEITTFTEESELPCEEARESMAILIRLKAAGARDEEKQLAKILQGRGRNGSDPSAAVDLVAVLDVSRSMEGTKLRLLKRAMKMVVRSLGCSDRLSVVAFAAKARRVMALRRMTEEGKRAAMEAVDALACTAGTAIAEALRKGTEILKQRRFRNPVATVVLLSDGRDDSSSPISRAAESNQLSRRSAIARSSSSASDVATAATRGQFEIPVHTFTLQSHSDSHRSRHGRRHLESISEESNGSPVVSLDVPESLHILESSHGDGELRAGNNHCIREDAFAQRLGGLLSAVALRVQIEIKVNPDSSSCPEILGVELGDEGRVATPSSSHGPLASAGWDAIAAGSHIRVSLGDLYSHEERDLLVHVRVPAVASSPWPSPSSSSCGRRLKVNTRNSCSPPKRGESASSATTEALMAVCCRYTDPSTGASLQTAPTQILLHRYPSQEAVTNRHADGGSSSSAGSSSEMKKRSGDGGRSSTEADRQRNRLRAARAAWEAMAMARSGGNVAGALRCLEAAREKIQGSEAGRRGDEASMAMEAELERIQESMRRRRRRRKADLDLP